MKLKGARKYDKRIGLFQATYSPDGFGGTLANGSASIGERWALVEDVSEANAAQYRNENGLRFEDTLLRFTMRYIDTLDMETLTISYKGQLWSPLSIQQKGQYNVETVIIAAKSKAAG